jgi:hypothetical protein
VPTLEIMALAKRRLADAAQTRGQVVGCKGGSVTNVQVRNAATSAAIGLSRKEIHEARIIRDAEAAEPERPGCAPPVGHAPGLTGRRDVASDPAG